MLAKMTSVQAILAVWCIGLAAPDAHASEWTDQLNGSKTDYVSNCDTCAFTDSNSIALDSLDENGFRAPLMVLKDSFYRNRYQAESLLDKIVGNQGEGFEGLYGTRNLRPILHGAAYRGGGNNYFHRTDKRHNNNPLPDDGVKNLCEEGFSSSVYLYRRNWDSAPKVATCDCLHGGDNALDYVQLDYFDDAHIYKMLEMVHESATNDSVGPVYFHCWNGWHASGLISGIALRQFCSMSPQDAVNYWDLGTDGQNRSPRYQKQRDRIKNFEPYPELLISDSLQGCMCPVMPTDIDSSQLHIDLDHLILVPEALAVGQTIVCSNVKFGSGSTSFSSSAKAKKDLDRIVKAMDLHPELIVEVGGHTDKSGSASQNATISKGRARTVYNYLINKGVPDSRLTYRGYGQNSPIVSNKYKSTRALNRRIEVKVVSKGNENMTSLVDESKLDAPETTIATRTVTPVETTTASPTETTTTPTKITPANTQVRHNIANLEEYYSQFKTGESLVLNHLVFQPYSSKITDKSNKDLLRLYRALKENPKLKVQVNGYTDSSGDAAANKEISKQRAKAVYKYLINKGIDADRLRYKGYGASNPRYSNKYKSTRAQNRRIEAKIL
jgi:outer membrane protein OmpA-like peptidoglycan-associated protein